MVKIYKTHHHHLTQCFFQQENMFWKFESKQRERNTTTTRPAREEAIVQRSKEVRKKRFRDIIYKKAIVKHMRKIMKFDF